MGGHAALGPEVKGPGRCVVHAMCTCFLCIFLPSLWSALAACRCVAALQGVDLVCRCAAGERGLIVMELAAGDLWSAIQADSRSGKRSYSWSKRWSWKANLE